MMIGIAVISVRVINNKPINILWINIVNTFFFYKRRVFGKSIDRQKAIEIIIGTIMIKLYAKNSINTFLRLIIIFIHFYNFKI